ncbi:MAG: nuclear transport factor 2 family protein [Thermoleophilaceae bacterium]
MERWFDAFNTHDIEALLQLAHPEIEIVPLSDAVTSLPGTTYHGHEGMRSLLAPGFERWTRLHITPAIMEWDGDWVIGHSSRAARRVHSSTRAALGC